MDYSTLMGPEDRGPMDKRKGYIQEISDEED